ncbi:hypothetical protein BDV96DRAFT_567284 [Lophiotrema nucula]|uniref:Uncharacterized protein n=1 Tax=Lophiotrema nucula TaxID=690887 RepID=A0A6A5ZK79_9PLEO|nr:hypothetical protein BDV96DRAFT_567284 [Lophiotrema nucula]
MSILDYHLYHQPTPYSKSKQMYTFESTSAKANMSAQSSTATTPFTQSRRASQESARSNTSAKGDKHFMKKIWTTVKKHAIEHHRSVNAAYDACYGQGMKVQSSM